MNAQRDLGNRQSHHFALRDGTMDFYVGWLYGYAQVGGMSPGSIADALGGVRSGDPGSWVRAFAGQVAYQRQQAATARAAGHTEIAAQHYLAAVTAARAVLHFAPPGGTRWHTLVAAMSSSFQAAMELRGWPVVPWEVPFAGHALPGYVTPDLDRRDTVVVVVGGGDTYREDLWFFGGADAAARGYAVALCDLPGQGTTPDDGLHFGQQTLDAIPAVLDALSARGFTGRTVLLGWSGGGYFVTKAVEQYGRRVDAWIASTPVGDIARMLEQAMPALLRRDPAGLLSSLGLRAARRLSPVLAASLAKYDWQFGAGGIAGMLDQLRTVGVVDPALLDRPMLALVGASEDREARDQARTIHAEVVQRHPASRIVEFTPASGADAHCQVNNLPLAFEHIAAWLAEIGLAPPPAAAA